MTKKEFKGLENKLKASIGTLLCLVNESDSVVGFLVKKNKKKVTLSFENPNNTREYCGGGGTYSDYNVYDLSFFKDYYTIPL